MDPTPVVTPTNIAVAAAAFIALEIASGGLKEIGKEIYGKVKESLKGDELIKLDLFEKYPESKELQNEVAAVLTKHLESKPDLVREFEELLNKAGAATSTRNVNIQQGEENYNIQSSPGTQINRGGK